MVTDLPENNHSNAPEIKNSNHFEDNFFGPSASYFSRACEVSEANPDIPFYVETAIATGGPVLEVACGTGRTLIPTARAGIQIDGLDHSPAALAQLNVELAKEPKEVQERVFLHQGDMRNFSLEKRFKLITIPFHSLQHLFCVEDQLATFQCFSAHLNPGGRLVFNVFFPDFKVFDDIGTERTEIEWKDLEDSAVTIRRSFIRTSVDLAQQFFEGEFIFKRFRENNLSSQERYGYKMSWYTYPQILLLLKVAGFDVEEQYGSFQREPISAHQELILVAKKPE